MSLNINREVEKNNQKIKTTKTESSKFVQNLLNGKQHSADEKAQDRLSFNPKVILKKTFTKKNSIKDEKPLRINRPIENHERSTFFIDAHENKGEIRDSDIVFQVVLKDDVKKKNSEEKPRSIAQKNWGVILNVFKALTNMRNINAKNVKSVTEIDRELTYWEKFKKKNLETKENNSLEYVVNKDNEFEEITKQILLFEYIALGLDENIDAIINIVKKDPKRNVYDETEKHHYFVNKKNYKGLTPLYVCCLNGHAKIVEPLIKYGADHLLKCGDKGDEDSVLSVAVRWGHAKVVEFLLTLKWPLEYLKAGLKEALERKNEQLIKMMKMAISDYNSKHKKKYGCFSCF